MAILKMAIRVVFALIVATVFLGISNGCLAESSSEETLAYAVKGAYLFKFCAFVEWPPTAFSSANSPIVIGIIGDDPFGEQLDRLVAGRTIEGRSIVVRHALRLEQIQSVHVLFIGQSEKARLPAIRAALQGGSVLTVADFWHPDVIITFLIDRNKVRFEINLAQAEKSELKLSSKLLSVAKAVRGE